MNQGVRLPAVAGRFYPSDANELTREVSDFIGDTAGARPALGIMVPHAGYVYSGRIAGKTFAQVQVPKHVIVLAPNHTGRGPRIAVLARGVMRIPGHDMAIAHDLADRLVDSLSDAQADDSAHQMEHAIEVELPFVLARNRDAQVVPIVLGGLSAQEVLAFGAQLAAAGLPKDTLVVASSDMNHFLDDAATRDIDQLALSPLLALDAAGLIDAVRQHDITMCGVRPAAAMLAYATARGARTADLVEYGTSADAHGDRERVVGYAGVVVR